MHDHHDMAVSIDPVCGMRVKPESSPYSTLVEGILHRFCSAKCKTRFDADPAHYLGGATITRRHDHPAPRSPGATITRHQPIQAAPPGVEYTCPMRPEVRQIGPGTCPRCGMALEPLQPSLEEVTEDGEYADFRRRFWFTLPLTIIVTPLAMAGHYLSALSSGERTWIEFLLSMPIVLWAGAPFFVRGWQSLVTRNPNMWPLIALGTEAAFLYSIAATVAPGVFPASFVVHGPSACISKHPR